MPLLEVQHGGHPVVAPDSPVIREVLGHSGLLIRPEDPEGSAARIAAFVTDESFAGAVEASRSNVQRWNGLAALDADRLHAFLDGDPSAYADGRLRIA